MKAPSPALSLPSAPEPSAGGPPTALLSPGPQTTHFQGGRRGALGWGVVRGAWIGGVQGGIFPVSESEHQSTALQPPPPPPLPPSPSTCALRPEEPCLYPHPPGSRPAARGMLHGNKKSHPGDSLSPGAGGRRSPLLSLGTSLCILQPHPQASRGLICAISLPLPPTPSAVVTGSWLSPSPCHPANPLRRAQEEAREGVPTLPTAPLGRRHPLALPAQAPLYLSEPRGLSPGGRLQSPAAPGPWLPGWCRRLGCLGTTAGPRSSYF